jgi:hypothetical protein
MESITIFRQRRKISRLDKALAANERADRLQERLDRIFNLGHNDDCLFCGLKDKEAIFAAQEVSCNTKS